MPSTLAPSQIESALKYRHPVTDPAPSTFNYNPSVYDDAVAGMFNRRYYEDEQFQPLAHKIKSALFRPYLGDPPEFDTLGILIAVAENTRNGVLRAKAVSALKMHITDVSGTDCSLKPQITALLNKLKKDENS